MNALTNTAVSTESGRPMNKGSTTGQLGALARRLCLTRPMTVHSGVFTKASQAVEAPKPTSMEAMAPALVMRRE